MNTFLFLLIILGYISETLQEAINFGAKKTCRIDIEDWIDGQYANNTETPINSLYQPYRTVQDEKFIVLFSCSSVPIKGSCKVECIYQKKTNKLIYAGKDPTKTGYADEEPKFLLKEQMKCADLKNYKIRIKMLESELKEPRLTVKPPCELEIEIGDPEYQPKCTYYLPGRGLIDLRPLNETRLSIHLDGTVYHLAFCNYHPDCDDQYAVCATTNTSKKLLGTVTSQVVYFNEGSNRLEVTSKSLGVKKKAFHVVVHVKCNWRVPGLENGKYIKPSVQGRSYKFEVESSFACIKTPKNCLIRDKANYLTYDLRGLANESGSKVNGTKEHMRINICENLASRSNQSDNCTAQFSQACEIRVNSYLNKGSLPSFELREEGWVRATLRDGDKCSTNKSYTTIVDVKCSLVEKGPVFQSEKNCETIILWETPKACPSFEVNSDKCSLETYVGDIDLSKLHSSKDEIYLISKSRKLKYNICGQLNSTCSGDDTAVACLLNSGVEKVVGREPPTLNFTNGQLQLEYRGEKCSSQKHKSYSLRLNMICSFNTRKRATKIVQQDDCTFVGNVRTDAACFSKEVSSCYFEDKLHRYDLTPLISKDRNYRLIDKNNTDITYFLNVCGPLINEPGLYLSLNSMALIRDMSQPFLRNRFKSLSLVTTPQIIDGKLQLVSKQGQSCQTGGEYKSSITFECSQIEEPPRLVNKGNCSLDFMWKTKYACPKLKSDAFCHLTAGEADAVVSSNYLKVLSDRDNSTYEFNLCENNYRKCNNKNLCVDAEFSRSIRSEKGGIVLEFNFNTTGECIEGFPISKVKTTIECDTKESMLVSRMADEKNCQINFIVKTSTVCKEESKIMEEEKSIIEFDGDRKVHISEGETASSSEVADTEDMKKNVLISQKGRTTDKIAVNEVDHKSKAVEANKIESTHTQIDQSNKPSKSKDQKTVDKKERDETEVVNANNEQYKYARVEELIKQSRNENEINNDTEKHAHVSKEIERDVSKSQSCDTIKMNDHTFQLSDINSSEISKYGSTFSINFDGSLHNCAGKICRNGMEVLHIIENCPKLSNGDNFFLISFTISTECNHNNQSIASISNINNVDVLLRCNATGPLTTIEESGCKLTINYSAPPICQLLSNKNSKVWFYFGVFLVVVSICAIGLAILKKKYLTRCSYTQVGGIERINHSKLL